MAKITKVPNGPLIKKTGKFKGSTLKNGGPVKKAQVGIYQPMNPRTKFKTRSEDGNYKLKLKGDKLVERRTLKGFFSGAPRAQGKMDLNGDNVKLLKSLRSITNSNDLSSSKDKDKDGVKSSDGSWDSIRPKYPTPFKFAKINKNGGKMKKAKVGATITKAKNGTTTTKTTIKPDYSNIRGGGFNYFKTPTAKDSSDYRKGFDKKLKGEELKQYNKGDKKLFPSPSSSEIRGYNEASERIKKSKPRAKAGAMIKRAQNGESFTKDGKEYTYTKQVTKPEGKRTYQGKSKDQSTAMKIANFKIKNNPSDSLRTVKPVIKKNGGMIKRADGSMSKRGLWDNIRANKGSGKKPTKQMLVQEKKIKAKSKK